MWMSSFGIFIEKNRADLSVGNSHLRGREGAERAVRLKQQKTAKKPRKRVSKIEFQGSNVGETSNETNNTYSFG